MTNSFEKGGDMIAEDELRELFASRRSSTERFAAGVAERLAAADRGGRPPASGGSVLGRAASAIPGISKGGWATIFSWPALLLFGVFALFFHSSQSMDATLRDNAERPPDSWLVQTLRKHALSVVYGFMPILGSLLGIAFMSIRQEYGGSAVINTATVVILVAMTVLTFLLGQYARTRGALVRQVGDFVIALQLMALFGCVLWVQILGVFDGDSALGYGATGWVLTAGAVVVSIVTLVLARAWYTPVSIAVVLALLPSATVFGLPDNSASAIRDRLAVIELQTDALSGWRAAGRMASVLAACGEDTGDLSAIRGHVEQAITTARPGVHPLVWTGAADMGLIDDAHWQELAAQPEETRRLNLLLSRRGRVRFSDYNGYLLPMLLATREVGDEQRAHIVARIEQSWPAADDKINTDDLGQALVCIEWLEGLGRRDLIEARTDELHQLLRRHWVSEAVTAKHAFPGGFASDPESGSPGANDTSYAIQIIERVGSPPDVPLQHVRAYLRHHSKVYYLPGIGKEPVLKMQSRADYYMLTKGIGLPLRGPLELLIGERMFIAALLLALLSLRAVLLADRHSRGATPGAMP